MIQFFKYYYINCIANQKKIFILKNLYLKNILKILGAIEAGAK